MTTEIDLSTLPAGATFKSAGTVTALALIKPLMMANAGAILMAVVLGLSTNLSDMAFIVAATACAAIAIILGALELRVDKTARTQMNALWLLLNVVWLIILVAVGAHTFMHH